MDLFGRVFKGPAPLTVRQPVDPRPAVSAIVTAFARVEQTLAMLRVLQACDPAPAEILVHVDGGDGPCAEAVRHACPGARLLMSPRRVGPGGGRNTMLAAATHPIVASFDDDSSPIDRDYFARVAAVFATVPDASVVGASVYHSHQPVGPDARSAAWVADFSGGACAYRRDHFLETGGYVPLTAAYGMEEVDLAIRLHARGRRVLHTPWLRVFHDTDLARHADPDVTAASVANLALLTFLRYPVTMWIVGAAQCLNRIAWLSTHGRRRGILPGLFSIPALLRAHVPVRRTVPAAALGSYLRLRRRSIAVSLDVA